MVELFVSGGPLFMSVLTLLFVAILTAAWKAPAWVKDLGRIALVFGILGSVLGFYQMFGTLTTIADVPSTVFYAGMKVVLVPFIYGIIISLVALGISLFQKPRI